MGVGTQPSMPGIYKNFLAQELIRYVGAHGVPDESSAPWVPSCEGRYIQDGAIHDHPGLTIQHLE